MKLKCIGGPNHNKYEDVTENYRMGDMVRVREPRKFNPVVDIPIPFDPYKASELMTDIIHLYVLDSFKWRDPREGIVEFKFLRYQEISMIKVFDLMFT